MAMQNAVDYLRWRGDLSLEASPVNEVDILLFSQVVIPDLKGIVSGNVFEISWKEAMDRYFADHTTDRRTIGVLQSDQVLGALKEAGESRRFSGLGLCGYVCRFSEEEDEQFSAITVCAGPDLAVVSFMGTDDTITGWKEDFHLCIMDEIPAQRDAAAYLQWIAGAFPRAKIGVCGHSKGGNLAVYAAASAPEEVQKRLAFVYNFDGPGLQDSARERKGFRLIRDKVRTVVSCHTTVGTLMNLGEPLVIVQTDTPGMLAHDPFRWEVLGTKFIRTEELHSSSVIFGYTIKNMLEQLSVSERKEFIDEFFDLLTSAGARTVTDILNTDLRDNLQVLSRMSKDRRLSRVAQLCWQEAEKNIRLAKKGDLKPWENTD